MIEDYSFGQITIDGSRYNTDVIIYPDGRVDHTWWRDDSHTLTAEDIRELIASTPEWIIAGTGEYGMMKPDPNLEKELGENGIKLEVMPTTEAVQLYNDLSDSAPVGACLHLTC